MSKLQLSIFFLLSLFLFNSCKFNPSVTSNKRKYRKGHYKPLREEVASNSHTNTKSKYSAKKQSHTTMEKPSVEKQKKRLITKSTPKAPHQKEAIKSYDKPTPISSDDPTVSSTPSHDVSIEQKESSIESEEEPDTKEKPKKKLHTSVLIAVILHAIGIALLATGLILLSFISNIIPFIIVGVLLSVAALILYIVGVSGSRKYHSKTNRTVAITGIIVFGAMILAVLITIIIAIANFSI